MYNKIKFFFKSLKRAYDFAIIGWNNRDYDYAYLYKLILIKLIRIEKELKNGFCEHDKSTLQSLRICIKLLNNITEDSYDHNINLHDSKWGDLIVSYKDSDIKGFRTMEFNRPNAVTEQDKELQTKELRLALEKDDAQKTKHINLLFSIMAKYSRTWWD